MEFIENSSSKSSTKNATNRIHYTKEKDRLRVAKEAAQKRGALEQSRRDMEQYASGLAMESLRADWEAEGERRTLHSRVRREVGKASDATEEELGERRERLHDLLRSEEEKYLQEELEMGRGAEDPEAKWDRMLARYLELRTKKEEERQRVAHEKRELQFRLNCDDLRSQLSCRLQAEVAYEGKIAASEKKTSKIDDEAYDELWRRDEEAKKKMEEDEKMSRRRKAVKAKKEMMEQIEEKKERRWMQVLEKETDAEIRAEHNRLLALEAECEKEARRRKKEVVRSDLDACVNSKMRLKAQETQDDRLEDMFFLTQAMGDAEDKMAREEKKKRLLLEQRNFLEYTREAGRRRNAEEVEAERICREAMDKEARKQQEDINKEKGHTKEKNREAAHVIRQQMEDNLEQLRRAFSANREMSNKVFKKDEEDKKMDKEKRTLAKEADLMYQNELLNQIEIKKKKLEEEMNLNNTEIQKLLEAQEEEDIKVRHLVAEMKIDHEHPYRIARRQFFNDCGDREA
ncbi:hypothetical protein JTE90_016989 [Oedothorax gibbosus]|uniref:Cilia- and flagella-associated protein 53 n=1 Tax=Oedothorax gibbosus TaxID=931172 RepID=A0AAV6UM65_9ARAC|nr:hypothetical protein JTE90_016989 [Oedothorax gibbosus]